jgi:hypothetical protein
MGDGPVLAENTAKITVGEKNGARASFSCKRYFFAEMGLGRMNYYLGRSAAKPLLAFEPVYPASARAKLALLKHGVGLLDPMG